MSGRVVIDQINRVLAFSTTTPLAANAVYTSPTIDAINYKFALLSGLSDQAGTYQRQHSHDGVTWFVDSAAASVPANSPLGISNNIYRRYFRIIYTNGATAQTSFDFSCYLSPL